MVMSKADLKSDKYAHPGLISAIASSLAMSWATTACQATVMIQGNPTDQA